MRALGGVPGLVHALEGVLGRAGPAVVVATSGSTGRPKQTVLSTQALRASARATAQVTGGPGQWLLCLPAHYVAGVQVLVRSVLAGTDPVVMTDEHFTPRGFVTAAQRLSANLRFVSLVPTQLQRLMAAESPDVVAALRSFTAILLGGSAASPALLERARALGAPVVTTYGMSETAGGCVYDGVPLPGVRIHLEPHDTDPANPVPPSATATSGPVTAAPAAHSTVVDPARTTAGTPAATAVPRGASGPSQSPRAPEQATGKDRPRVRPPVATTAQTGVGRIWLGGPMVTDGYLDDPTQTASHLFDTPQNPGPPHADPATAHRDVRGGARNASSPRPHQSETTPQPDVRWYRTDDLGQLTHNDDGSPHLTVLGRVDDVIVTGGIKVSAGVVRLALLEDPRVADAVVTGVTDPVWGQRIVAVVVPNDAWTQVRTDPRGQSHRTPTAPDAVGLAGTEIAAHSGVQPDMTTDNARVRNQAEHSSLGPDPGDGTNHHRPSPGANEAAAPLIADLSDHLGATLGSPAVPKQWCVVEQLPLLPTGKPDLSRVRTLFVSRTDGAGNVKE